jgi:hypothetical protein
MLNYLLSLRGLLLAIGIGAVLIWILEGSPSFQSCIHPEQHESASQNFIEDIPGLSIPLIRYRDCLGSYTRTFHEDIIAGFTVLLSVVTVFLWLATRQLVKGAETASQQELRAYVFAGDIKLELDPSGTPFVTINVQNVGKTPAYGTTILRTARTFIGNEIRSFPAATKSITTSKIDLGQGVGAVGQLPVGEILNQNGLAALKTGDIELFVFGIIEYRDIFGKRRTTEFRFVMGGHHKWPSDNRLVACEDGNKAT